MNRTTSQEQQQEHTNNQETDKVNEAKLFSAFSSVLCVVFLQSKLSDLWFIATCFRWIPSMLVSTIPVVNFPPQIIHDVNFLILQSAGSDRQPGPNTCRLDLSKQKDISKVDS